MARVDGNPPRRKSAKYADIDRRIRNLKRSLENRDIDSTEYLHAVAHLSPNPV